MKKNEMNEKDKKNWFVRILIIIMSFIILGMVIISFFLHEPKYVLNYGILIALLIVVFLITAELFDSFSIGKIFSAKKEIEKKDKEIDKISTENNELRNQIVNVFTASNQNINNLKFMFSGMKVEVATDDDKLKKQENEESFEKSINEKPKDNSIPLYRLMPEIEKVLIKRYINEQGIGLEKVIEGVKFVGPDPIMDKPYIYDAYCPSQELFFEVSGGGNLILQHRLYYAISKIYHYRISKNNNAKMILLIPLFPEKYNYRNYSNKIYEFFSPAIKDSLLDIRLYAITENEYEETRKRIMGQQHG